MEPQHNPTAAFWSNVEQLQGSTGSSSSASPTCPEDELWKDLETAKDVYDTSLAVSGGSPSSSAYVKAQQRHTTSCAVQPEAEARSTVQAPLTPPWPIALSSPPYPLAQTARCCPRCGSRRLLRFDLPRCSFEEMLRC